LLEYPLTNNKELESYYMRMGLNYTFKMDFSNIEIVWSYMKLIYPTNFDSILKNRINNANFIVIPLGIEISSPHSGTHSGSHANILIIDDEEKIHFLLTRMLTRDGYEVFIAQNGVEGV
jgi:hypothetical protein